MMRRTMAMFAPLLFLAAGCSETASNTDAAQTKDTRPSGEAVTKDARGEAAFPTSDVRREGSTPDVARPDGRGGDSTAADAASGETWVTPAGGSGTDTGRAVAVDGSGNVYVTGEYTGQATFGKVTLIARGSRDVFVAKLTPRGDVEWAVSAGGMNWDSATGIGLDAGGGVTITGTFLMEATFGTISLAPGGMSTQVFVAKLSATGDFLWAVAGGGSGNDQAFGIAVTAAGDAYVAGSYEKQATFGTTLLQSKGLNDVFVAKVSSGGSFVWATSAGGPGVDEAYAIAVDSAGDPEITGHFGETAEFGATTLTCRGVLDVFVAKLSSAGQFVWATSGGGVGAEEARGIAVDGSGYGYITGEFSGQATFGPSTLTSGGQEDVFVARLSPSGQFLWAAFGGAPDSDTGYAIVADSAGDAYLTGSFEYQASFGLNPVMAKGYDDVFVAKISSSGKFLAAAAAGSTTYLERGQGIALDASGAVYVTGQFQSKAKFGGTSLTSAGDADVFVWKVAW